uniref:Endonuclease/exonuclease/phosphatase domain-containing protein n=1 Tax=Anopheles atroparvus TaxID=41427 RepID=A0A182IK97_ANOAO
MKRRLLSVFITPRHLKYYSRRLFWFGFGHHAEAVVDTHPRNMEPRLVYQKAYFDNNRRWKSVASGNGQQSSSIRSAGEQFEFTLMSYNILAQDLLDSHAELYAHHYPQALPWAHRYKRLMAEINAVHPDILCVQELQQEHVDQFWTGLASFNYGLLYKKRTGGGKTDGCAVFYRRNLFDLVTHHEVEYFQPNVNKLNRENVAIIAKLSLKSNPHAKLVVSTTHLLYNPRRQDVRLAQIQVLLAELDRLAYSGQCATGLPQYDPVILCGDFNLQPHTAPYRLLTERFLRYDCLIARSLEPEAYGYGEPTGKDFLPASLGITDRCQHDSLNDRERTHGDATVPPSDATKLYHSEYVSSSSVETPRETQACTSESNGSSGSPSHRGKGGKNQSPKQKFSTGSLSHRFLFNSAYPHEPARFGAAPEHHERTATTFQQEWVTVDYMFYTPFRSVSESKQAQPSWNLELLGTYALPTVQKCSWKIGNIPNMFYGSDHFSLAGRFLLTTPTGKQ